MLFFDSPLTKDDVEKVKKYGKYVKITADLENERIVVGCELHADGEKILLEKGGKSDDIWGGGIDFEMNKVSTAAVLNIRPRLDNDNMEILNPDLRSKFVELVKELFKQLWL
jgi:hypothetical protein